MKSILLRFPDKVVRYIRGKKTSEREFGKIVSYGVHFGCVGWCLDNQEAHNSMGWDMTTSWEKITEVTVDSD